MGLLGACCRLNNSRKSNLSFDEIHELTPNKE